MDQRNGPGVVNRRGCVWHANDGGESAARGSRRAGGKVFLWCLARLTQMNVQVNQAGANNQSAHVHPLNIGRALLCGGLTNGGDFAVENQQVSLGIQAIGGVNNPPAGQQQRVHAS
jgi:hypothetical protein